MTKTKTSFYLVTLVTFINHSQPQQAPFANSAINYFLCASAPLRHCVKKIFASKTNLTNFQQTPPQN
jgi:hypothetical protein